VHPSERTPLGFRLDNNHGQPKDGDCNQNRRLPFSGPPHMVSVAFFGVSTLKRLSYLVRHIQRKTSKRSSTVSSVAERNCSAFDVSSRRLRLSFSLLIETVRIDAGKDEAKVSAAAVALKSRWGCPVAASGGALMRSVLLPELLLWSPQFFRP
jgi:hypothetical protein